MRTNKVTAIALTALMMLAVFTVMSATSVSAGSPSSLPTGKITSPREGATLVAYQPFSVEYSLSSGSENYRWLVEVIDGGGYFLTDVTGKGSIQFENSFWVIPPGTHVIVLWIVNPQTEMVESVDQVTVKFVAGEPSALPVGKIISPKAGADLPLNQPWTLKYTLSPGSENYDWYITVVNTHVYKLTDVKGAGTFQVPGEIMQGPGYYQVKLCRADPGSDILTVVDVMTVDGVT